jgi:hypothetical protein
MKIHGRLHRVSTGEKLPVRELNVVPNGIEFVGEGRLSCQSIEDFALEMHGSSIHFRTALNGSDRWVGDGDTDARLVL